MLSSKETKLNESVLIKDEGVYYTLFLFENVGKNEEDSKLKSNSIIWTITPHLLLNGDIVYHNTDGYMNGEQQKYLTYYPIVTLLNTAFTIYWAHKMNKFRAYLINIHYYVLAIIIISLFRCILKMK
jgi:hypothetical protein